MSSSITHIDTTPDNINYGDNSSRPSPSLHGGGLGDSDGKCLAELYYESKNQSLKTLATMCRGLKDENGKKIKKIQCLHSDNWLLHKY